MKAAKERFEKIVFWSLSVYLGFMALQPSFSVKYSAIIVPFIVFCLFFYLFLHKFSDIFINKLYQLLTKPQYKVKLKHHQLKNILLKAWLIPSILLMSSSLFIVIWILFFSIQGSEYYMTGTNERGIQFAHYTSKAESIYPFAFYLLFIIICLFPITLFIILKFQESFGLYDSLRYTIITSIIFTIVINVLYRFGTLIMILVVLIGTGVMQSWHW